ncbi:uncharacterized protein FA14DRAFT_166997 [Meira miltonrushii]|uniref:Uncharacterized protein n=1 Tax=Meira miltonrushii TaxID=1280837 RepID=A0A316VP27_9BASI|nr:uncharacterized protein FA14DRAFT_166997 [Meira miltonrushii]PWN38163.1 hypothetical protein FA14DRAFT_166997 [Meira miltonrushii]
MASRRTFSCDGHQINATKRNPLPSKVLIANRGEIACRVIRTCRRLGIRTVAVYSEADARSAHALLADEAYCIGPAPSAESYLRMDRIIEICKQTGAEMVHPGYGFLSENADFANNLHAAGIKFIGPPAQAIISMGSKSASKEIMTEAGVPCVPGYHGSDQSDVKLKEEAQKIGFPVLIKAVKGGGGKGMKIVTKAEEFDEQLQSARREALTSFGDGDVLIERYLTKPRHVEVQIVSSGAPFNEHVAISTRDCSVQRRHQKIIEEAPAPHLSPEVEKDLCDKATAAARAVGYEGAGTVEFILDADTGEAWFLECNTRLQVEHPVSEMVSGIDLVEWQLEAASGNSLPLRQDQIGKRGHAFEARIYAEDTRANFLPDVGHLSHVAFPVPTTALLSPPPLYGSVSGDSEGVEALSSVRVDTGVATGDEVSVYYDPMIAKVIVHGRDRLEALRLMRAALQETHIVGPKTNVDFLSRLCEHQAFIDGSGLETGFIGKYKSDLHPPLQSHKAPDQETAIHAALFLAVKEQSIPSSTFILRRRAKRSDAADGAKEEEVETSSVTVTRVPHLPNRYQVSIANEHPVVENGYDNKTSSGRSNIKVITRSAAPSGPISTKERLDLFVHGTGAHYELDVVAPNWYEEVKGAKMAEKGSLIAPMPSKVVDVRVQVGQEVQEGDIVVVLEAMKTEHTLRAPKAGVVAKIAVEKGAMCAEGTELVQFEEEGKEEEK